jgi:hypothetical protein
MTTTAPSRIHLITDAATTADMATIARAMGVYASRSDTLRLALRHLADTLSRTGSLPTPPAGQA